MAIRVRAPLTAQVRLRFSADTGSGTAHGKFEVARFADLYGIVGNMFGTKVIVVLSQRSEGTPPGTNSVLLRTVFLRCRI